MYESSWRCKGKRYLCYEKDPTTTYIITDLIIIKDDEQVPNGFSGIFLTEDTSMLFFSIHFHTGLIEVMTQMTAFFNPDISALLS